MLLHAHNMATCAESANNATPAQYKHCEHDSDERSPKRAKRHDQYCAGVALSPRQEQVLAALRAGMTQRETAADLGVSQQRVHRIADELRRKGVELPNASKEGPWT